MKKILLILLLIFPLYLIASLYLLDKECFISPVGYRRDIVIRSDNRGDGLFASQRGGGTRLHNGIDLLADVGTPVLAARSGFVIAATNNPGMGKYVIIKHSGNNTTIYGHLSRIDVSKNQFVRQGWMVGAVGKTGNANFRDMLPHLHFEVRSGGVPVDPFDYLR